MNDTRWSPLHIKLLLHYYYSPMPFEPESDASIEYQSELEANDLIFKTTPRIYICTKMGCEMIEGILNTPTPPIKKVKTSKWIPVDNVEDPREIEIFGKTFVVKEDETSDFEGPGLPTE